MVRGMDAPTWSTRITDCESRGWSLVELAREIGLSPQALSDIKRGATVEPRGMAAVRLHKLHAAGRKPAPVKGQTPEGEGRADAA